MNLKTNARPVIAAFFLLVLPAAASAAQNWNRTFTVGDRPKIVIDGSEAHVRVHARPGSTVEAVVTAKGKTVGLYFGSRKPTVSLEQDGDAIEIVAHSGSESRKSSGGIMITWLTLTVDVAVPPECDLEIVNDDGSVDVAGVDGRVSVRSKDGGVNLSDLRGEVFVHTSDGTVIAEDLDGRLEGSTSDGTMKVSGRFDGLDLESKDGKLAVEVRPGSKLADTWNLSTQDGGLDLGLPSALQATLDARVQDGGIHINLPKVDIDETDASTIHVDLNGGGPVLRVRSSDGHVRIRSVSS